MDSFPSNSDPCFSASLWLKISKGGLGLFCVWSRSKVAALQRVFFLFFLSFLFFLQWVPLAERGGTGTLRTRECCLLSWSLPRVAEGVALGDRKRTACDETWALSGVCCRRFTRASQVSPQQTSTSDSSPTTARCTMWTTQVTTQHKTRQTDILFHVPDCASTPPLSLLLLVCSHTLSPSLNSLRSLVLCETQSFSVQQRVRNWHLFLKQGIYSDVFISSLLVSLMGFLLGLAATGCMYRVLLFLHLK